MVFHPLFEKRRLKLGLHGLIASRRVERLRVLFGQNTVCEFMALSEDEIDAVAGSVTVTGWPAGSERGDEVFFVFAPRLQTNEAFGLMRDMFKG